MSADPKCPVCGGNHLMGRCGEDGAIRRRVDRLAEELEGMAAECQSGLRTSKADAWALTLRQAAKQLRELLPEDYALNKDWTP